MGWSVSGCDLWGLVVIDEDLQADWRGVLLGLKICRDKVRDGARLCVRHPSYMSAQADQKALLRDGVIGMVNEIIATAEIVREGNDNAAD